ncbi:MAG: DUF465 domain-containing protein [Rhodospirillales bacterium]|jgi:hypothetical protein|nr:DUF465 domain-containing protein [Rhodospirillales bacterium]HJO72596.1 DUF465 domain-containing protein [Rhodospirillales bacterium]
MSLDEKIGSLKAKHKALEEALEDEINRPYVNEIEIASLKKQKLRIKDELATLDRP